MTYIEPLESRIAPATLVSKQQVTYVDTDGDQVTVTVSKGDLTGKLTFLPATGNGPQQLQVIDLSGAQFAHADLNVSVQQVQGGDGSAAIGFLNGKGNDLGDIRVQGDIGKILAGDGNASTAGMGLLSLHSLGYSTNIGAPDANTIINGSVGDVNLSGDVNQASFSVTGGSKVTIASFHARNLIGGGIDYSGSVFTTGTLGPTSFLSIDGGSGDHTGEVYVGRNLDSLTDYNALGGGSGLNAGSIVVHGDAGPIAVGVLSGNAGLQSGAIEVDGTANSITGNRLVGGAKALSGSITVKGACGPISLADMEGAAGSYSGSIVGGSTVASVSLTYGITGGSGPDSGRIQAVGLIGFVQISNSGGLNGGANKDSGSIESDQGIGSVAISGNLSSGFGDGSASIRTNGDIGSVSVSGTVIGTASKPVIFSALGTLGTVPGSNSHYNIGSVEISSNVTFLDVLAGYDITEKAVQGATQVGTVHIAGTAQGVNVVAGIAAGKDGVFGTADDLALPSKTSGLSKIAEVTIDGATSNAPTLGHFGIVAQQVDVLSVNGSSVTLKAGPHNDQLVPVGAATDFFLNEV